MDSRRGLLAVLALQAVSEYQRVGRLPPVTSALILGNTLVYLRPGPLHRLLPSITAAAFNPHIILQYGDLKRLILSVFYHRNDAHLFYNMSSLLWKGFQLETSMGSIEFASMVATLLGLSQGITLLLARGLLTFFDYDSPYYYEYAVGFSGVLFAMKVVLNAQSDGYSSVYGVVIPTKYAAWAELLLIQLFVPGVSFLGHLGGILAGIVYLGVRGSFHGYDPITSLTSSVFNVVSWPLKFVRGVFRNWRARARTSGRRRVGRGSATGVNARSVWSCPACTYNNSATLDVCEMCSTMRQDHAFAPGQHNRSQRDGDLTVEELRQRRLARFDR